VECAGFVELDSTEESVEDVSILLGSRHLDCILRPEKKGARMRVHFEVRFVTKPGWKYLRLVAKTGSGRQRLLRRRLVWIRGRLDRITIPKSATTLEAGVNIVGPFRYEFGIAEAARLNARALEAARVPCSRVEAPFLFNSSSGNREFEGTYADCLKKKINLFHFNAPDMRWIHHYWPRVFRNGQYNIGFWFWELPRMPEIWKPGFRGLDEIWVASEFVKNSIAPDSPVPVHCVPLPVLRPRVSTVDRSDFGLPKDKFLLLSTYDLNSYSSRKNPMGVIKAFRLAVAENPNLHLVLKVNHAAQYPKRIQELLELAGQNITLISQTLSRVELSNLQACCDIFISMHRAEGFGLNIAECMALGKPVVATAYSGNMTFMTGENSCPIDYSMVEIEKTEGHYERGQLWADPSPQHAAECILRLAGDSAFYGALSRRAEADIAENFSLTAVAPALKGYYRRILEHLG
jgi:glycosyltransferase involved in cell wall biosynthesis